RAQLRAEVRRILKELAITTIYVTHDQEEALEIADRVAVMHDGVIEQIDTPRNLYQNPKRFVVADFLGVENLFKIEPHDLIEEDEENKIYKFGKRKLRIPRHMIPKDPERVFYLGIRPEKIKIGAPPAPDIEKLTGVVSLKSFRGEQIRYVVETDLGALVVHVQSTSDQDYKIGEKVSLYFNLEDMLVLL
ncbi:MAG: spermidine/putrescine ABC transporter ATP-binding protein, partial [Thermoproteota archaeon]